MLTVRTYVEGYLNADAQKIALAFHPSTILYSVKDEKLEAYPLRDWLLSTKNGQGKARPGSGTGIALFEPNRKYRRSQN